MERNHFPDTRHVGDGVWEYRIHSGPGIRIYYARQGDKMVSAISAAV